jgi:hypothetical protein
VSEDKPDAVSEGARKGGLKGGRARAAKMTAEERTAAARKAAEARWIPKATHAGTLRIGEIELPCFVLENGKRVLSQNGMAGALGMTRGGSRKVPGDRIANFLAGNAIKPFVPAQLAMIPGIPFRVPQGGQRGNGYEATVLADVCAVVLAARRARVLSDRYAPLIDRCEVLLGAFARVGIIALVDEATGYQADRARDELQKILDAYVVPEMRPYVPLFPTEFFKQIYRLHGWQFVEGNAKHPGVVGHFINEWIYSRLPRPVLPKLRELNPTNENGRRRHKHHQYLTVDTGLPHLDGQINSVVALMRAASGDKPLFERLLANAYPAPGEQMHLIPGDAPAPEKRR